MQYAPKAIQSSSQKLELLEAFRGIAALLIVVFHATDLFNLKFNQRFLLSVFEFGDSGVDFFFVLSGFFLALSGVSYIGNSDKAKDFLFKRCLRIYPFYWLISLCIIPIYFLVPSFGKGYETDIGVIFKSLLLIPQAHPPILSVAWFLSHLVFFYLAFLWVVLSPKIGSKLVLTGLSLSAFYSLTDILSGFQLRNNVHFLIDFIFSYHNLEFAAGFLVGLLFRKRQLTVSRSRSLLVIGCLSFVGFGLLDVYILHTSSKTTGIAHYYEFIAYGVSSVLIVAGAAFLEKCRRLSVNKGLLILGAASFSIYLTHYPILSVFTKAMEVMGLTDLGLRTLAMVPICVVTVLIGCMFHFSLEKRLVLLFRDRLTYKRA
ncbi:MAG: acyltransferase family protein [Leptolyngbyaceae cyanobacterium]